MTVLELVARILTSDTAGELAKLAALVFGGYHGTKTTLRAAIRAELAPIEKRVTALEQKVFPAPVTALSPATPPAR